ncbi:hypothetical protein ACOU99_002911 [Enterococcus hirae]
MKYRKKPVVIEAFKLNSRGLIGEEWFWDAVSENRIITYNFGKNYPQDAWCEIKTLEGIMVAKTGDYIIRGVEGEIYPCKPDIFEKTYDVASQQSQLDDNQKIVLEWAKEYLTETKNIAWFIEELAFLPTTGGKLRYREVAHSYESLNNKEKLDLLNIITLWAVEQEEAE